MPEDEAWRERYPTINDKHLKCEIETAIRNAAYLEKWRTINDKHLKCEIETILIVSLVNSESHADQR